MSRVTKMLGVFILAFFLSGCQDLTKNVNLEEYELQGGDINKTLRGVLGPMNDNEEYTLTTSTGPVLLHDGKASLSGWVGNTVQVVGQYSGTTLYVDEVSPVGMENTGLTPTPQL